MFCFGVNLSFLVLKIFIVICFYLQVITKILSYLPYKDRKSFALINKRWHYASNHPVLIKKEWIKYYSETCDISEPTDTCFDNFKQIFLKSERPFLELQLCFQHIDSILLKIDDLGSRIVTLYLMNLPSIEDFYLDSITNSCNVLETLSLDGAKNMTLTEKPRKSLLNLRSLIFLCIDNMSDRNFNLFMQCCPNLEGLGLIQCNIVEHISVIRRFYRDWEHCENFNSDDVFTYHSVVNYLKKNKTMNYLKLQNCKIVMNLPAHIKLKYLILILDQPMYFPREKLIDVKQLSLALSKFTSLIDLELKFVPCCLLSAVSQLQNIKRLSLQFTVNSSQSCNQIKLCLQTFVKSLSNMKELKELILIPWHKDEKISPIPEIPECILNSLTYLDCFFENRLQLVKLNKGLKCLRIQNGDILTITDLHYIFNKFTSLDHLCIDNCIVLEDDIFLSLPIINLKGKRNIIEKLKSFAKFFYF